MSTKKPVSKVVVEEPPENRPERGRYDWPTIAEQVKANAGKYVKVFDNDAASLATMIRNGDVASLRPVDGFTVTTRNNKRWTNEEGREIRTCSLYVKWNRPKRGAKK